MEIRHSIYAFRIKNNLTQVQLASALGLCQSYISKIEMGREEFPQHKSADLIKLMVSYRYPVDDIGRKLFDIRPLPDVALMPPRQRRVIGMIASGLLTDDQLTTVEDKCIEYIGGYKNAT